MDNRQQNTRARSKYNAFSQGSRNNRELRFAHNSGEQEQWQATASGFGSKLSHREYVHQAKGSLGSIERKEMLIGVAALTTIIAASGLGFLISNAGKVDIISAQPYSLTAQQPYQVCKPVSTTHYVKNHKNGTKIAVIGGVSGAAVGGLITHSWIGAGVGAAVGAVGGELIQHSHQADYATQQCQTAYRQIMVPVGYQVAYLQDNRVIQIITQHQPLVGTKIKLQELAMDQLTPTQQQQIVEQALNTNVTTAASQKAQAIATSHSQTN